jgi:hypothetical protein
MNKSSPSDYQLAHGGSKTAELNAARPTVRVRWKGRREQLPEAPFSAVVSQVHRQ